VKEIAGSAGAAASGSVSKTVITTSLVIAGLTGGPTL
jgi:hypothetical protein